MAVATTAAMVQHILKSVRRRVLALSLVVLVGGPHSLLDDVEGWETFTVAKLQGGYTRYFSPRKGLKPGLGVSTSAGFVPSTLESVYGSRFNAGFGVFLTLRPAVMRMAEGQHVH